MDIIELAGIVSGGMMGAGLMLSHIRTAGLRKEPVSLAEELAKCAFCPKPASEYDDRVNRWVCDVHAGRQPEPQHVRRQQIGTPHAQPEEDNSELAGMVQAPRLARRQAQAQRPQREQEMPVPRPRSVAQPMPRTAVVQRSQTAAPQQRNWRGDE